MGGVKFGYKKVENAAAVIWKMLLLAEQRFQRLNAQEKLIQVYLESGFRERNEETETKQEEVLGFCAIWVDIGISLPIK
jgi:hypothetical protein